MGCKSERFSRITARFCAVSIPDGNEPRLQTDFAETGVKFLAMKVFQMAVISQILPKTKPCVSGRKRLEITEELCRIQQN